MGQLVRPKVYLVGYTTADPVGIEEYLKDTRQEDFLDSWHAALAAGVSPGEALCSLYAKLCYKTLVLGKNSNVKRIRDIPDNIRASFDQGHGSVFEHCQLNFVVTNCSRVYTHEQVRHRIGWAYSQTSGRYCRLDNIDLVWDAILDPVKDLFLAHLTATEDVVYLAECRLGLRKPPAGYPNAPPEACLSRGGGLDTLNQHLTWVPDDNFNFDRRKQITSAIRRIAPNGQSNEMGMSCNVRALRHAVQMRTARFAEREIRDVFGQIYGLVKGRFPLIFHKAKELVYDELLEVRGMKLQPYEIEEGDPKALQFYDVSALHAELARRSTA